MHHIHRTPAYVLKSRPFKEADKQLVLLTKEFGSIWVTAQGVRKSTSKLRQSIQDYSLIDAALVHGRTGWRLTNAAFVNNLMVDIEDNNLQLSIARVFKLIDRLVAGESSEENVFDIVSIFVQFATDNERGIKEEDISSYEAIFIARILNILGYFADTDAKQYIESPLNMELINSLNTDTTLPKKEFIQRLNTAIRQSDL